MTLNAASLKTIESVNPCCSKWIKAHAKVEEKRVALRKGVGILQEQIDRLLLENADLKKACEEERARLNVVEMEKVKELTLRISLENEIAALKSEISSSKLEGDSGNLELENEVTHLRICISERETEINRLTQLLADEITRAALEKKAADFERQNAAEMQKSLQYEKSKADEACKMVDATSIKAEDYRVQLETLKIEIEKKNLKYEEVNRKLEVEMQNAAKEKSCSDEKRVQEEYCRANNLLKQLEDERQKVDKLQKEMQELMLSRKSADNSELDEVKRKLEAEKKKVAEEKKIAEQEKLRAIEQSRNAETNEKRVSEEKCRAAKLLKQLEEEKQKTEKLRREIQEVLSSQNAVDSSEVDALKRNLEEEKKAVESEKRRVEEEKSRVLEQRKIADANKKKGFEEKCRADKLLIQLEEEKQKVEILQREMQEVISSQKTAYSSELHELNRNLEAEKLNVARERERGDLEVSRLEEQKRLAESSIKNAMEEKRHADKLSEELASSRQMIVNLERELNKVNDLLEAKRQEVASEKTRADMQKLKSDEQGEIAVANELRAMEEKSRGDNLFLELENARHKLQDMEVELNKVKLSRDLGMTLNMAPAFGVNEQAARINLLQEQLKFEKKRVKHSKEVAKLEKDRNNILQQELQRLKQDFQCLLDHLGMLSDSFGARNGVTNVPKKSGLSQMRCHGDNELRMSSLSSRDASFLVKPNMRLVQAGLCMESTSGMENELDPLQGGSRGDTIPTSPLILNAASFSDEQLAGTQERVAGSLTMSPGLSVENPNQQATMLRGSNGCINRKSGEKVGIGGEHRSGSPVETVTSHAKKRRKILDEFESIKYMHLEGKGIFQEAEKKLFALQSTLLQPMVIEQEKENLPLPVNNTNLCGNSDQSSKKRKTSREPDIVCQQANVSNVQTDVNKLFAPSAIEIKKSFQSLPVFEINRVEHNQDATMNFEQLIYGGYMELLDLEDAVSEKCYKIAREEQLSPTLPEFDLIEFGRKERSLIVPISVNESRHQHGFQAHYEKLLFVLFSDPEDDGSIARIYSATRTCVAQGLFLQMNFSVQDILGALLLEKDLRPREKACVIVSLILLNFSAVSSSKPVNFHFLDSFSAHLQTVLFSSDTRDLLAKICNVHDLLTLIEDFILNRKIWSNNVNCELVDGCSSGVEILLEGEKFVLWPKMAPTNLVVAGGTVLASISKAVGRIGFVCEVSLKILQIDKAKYSLVLSILHSFAYVLGEDYFSFSNYSSVMKVVKSVVTFMEDSLAKNTNKNPQPGDDKRLFTPCVRCPFSEGSVSLDDVSSDMLEELQRHIVPGLATHSSNSEALSCILGDALSSLELIPSIKGWDWARDKMVPKLFKILESSHQDRVFATALVVLLGNIGRLGVEACGYDDAGVEGIKRHLLGLLHQTSASKFDTTLPMAIVYGLIGLYPKGHEMFQRDNMLKLRTEDDYSASSSSDIVSKFLSSLSNEQMTSLASLVNPYSLIE